MYFLFLLLLSLSSTHPHTPQKIIIHFLCKMYSIYSLCELSKRYYLLLLHFMLLLSHRHIHNKYSCYIWLMNVNFFSSSNAHTHTWTHSYTMQSFAILYMCIEKCVRERKEFAGIADEWKQLKLFTESHVDFSLPLDLQHQKFIPLCYIFFLPSSAHF